MRIEGWEDRLHKVIDYHSGQPFEWGKSDCLTLMLDAYYAVTQEHLWKDIDYSTREEAHAKLREHKFRNVRTALDQLLEEQPKAFVRRGDVCVADYPGAIMGGCAIVFGNVLVCKTEDGLTTVPLDLMMKAYKVD